MKKINVIGTSGSGKSHFSRRLAQKLDITYIEMDAIFWQPNWQGLATGVFLSKIDAALKQESWVLDGNHSKTNSVKWEYVDTIIWLDYGFFHTFIQIVFRSFKRSFSQKEIWEGTGNKESFKRSFFSSKSVVLWMLKNYWKTRKKYVTLFSGETLKNVRFVHVTSPKKAEFFLNSV